MQDSVARMGEVVFTTKIQTEIKALGLGSCIGLCVFDPVVKLGCIAHIMLPQSKESSSGDVGKYADTAVPYILKEMAAKGANPMRLRAAIVGGAQLFSFKGAETKMDVGRRNSEAVKKHLADYRLRLIAEDIGGNSGRTIAFNSVTGDVVVRQVGGEDRVLVNLAFN